MHPRGGHLLSRPPQSSSKPIFTKWQFMDPRNNTDHNGCFDKRALTRGVVVGSSCWQVLRPTLSYTGQQWVLLCVMGPELPRPSEATQAPTLTVVSVKQHSAVHTILSGLYRLRLYRKSPQWTVPSWILLRKNDFGAFSCGQGHCQLMTFTIPLSARNCKGTNLRL